MERSPYSERSNWTEIAKRVRRFGTDSNVGVSEVHTDESEERPRAGMYNCRFCNYGVVGVCFTKQLPGDCREARGRGRCRRSILGLY